MKLAVLIPAACLAMLAAAAFTRMRQVDGRWDFSNGRDTAVVGWPADETSNFWNVRPVRHFRTLTIQLPGRPLLDAVKPMTVYVDRLGRDVIKVQIVEEPVTQEQALQRLQQLAKQWNWRWDEAAFINWVEGTKKNDLTSIGVGDKWLGRPNFKNPHVAARIHHAIGDDNRPWRIDLFIMWPECI